MQLKLSSPWSWASLALLICFSSESKSESIRSYLPPEFCKALWAADPEQKIKEPVCPPWLDRSFNYPFPPSYSIGSIYSPETQKNEQALSEEEEVLEDLDAPEGIRTSRSSSSISPPQRRGHQRQSYHSPRPFTSGQSEVSPAFLRSLPSPQSPLPPSTRTHQLVPAPALSRLPSSYSFSYPNLTPPPPHTSSLSSSIDQHQLAFAPVPPRPSIDHFSLEPVVLSSPPVRNVSGGDPLAIHTLRAQENNDSTSSALPEFVDPFPGQPGRVKRLSQFWSNFHQKPQIVSVGAPSPGSMSSLDMSNPKEEHEMSRESEEEEEEDEEDDEEEEDDNNED